VASAGPRSGTGAPHPFRDRFLSLAAEVLEITADELTDDLGPASFGQWTSLKHLQLVAAVERAYGIRLSPREIRSFNTLGGLAGLIASKGIET
jgi:acyl carrier protein